MNSTFKLSTYILIDLGAQVIKLLFHHTLQMFDNRNLYCDGKTWNPHDPQETYPLSVQSLKLLDGAS